MTFKVLN